MSGRGFLVVVGMVCVATLAWAGLTALNPTPRGLSLTATTSSQTVSLTATDTALPPNHYLEIVNLDTMAVLTICGTSPCQTPIPNDGRAEYALELFDTKTEISSPPLATVTASQSQ